MSKKELIQKLRELEGTTDREDAIKFYNYIKDSKKLIDFDNKIDSYEFKRSYKDLKFYLIQDLESFRHKFYSLSSHLIFVINHSNNFD